MESEVVRLLRYRNVHVQSSSLDSAGRQLLHGVENGTAVTVVLSTFNTSTSWRAAKDSQPTALVHPHLVERRKTLDFKVTADCWVLANVCESMSQTLENEIAERRGRKAPWSAQELAAVLQQLATLLAHMQSKGNCIVDLSPRDLYLCDGCIKLPQDRWVAVGPDANNTLKSSVLSLGKTVLAMAALNPHAQDLQALKYPKWLKYFIEKMLEPIPQLRPDFPALISILEKSKTRLCRHCTPLFEGHGGCTVCRRFCCLLCSKCEDQRTPLCRECKERDISPARTPPGTDHCGKCRQLKEAESLVLLDDGVNGMFCASCAQEELDEHEAKCRCKSSIWYFLTESFQHAL